MQCSDLMKRNSMTTTLPLKAESCVVLPEGSAMVSSGDFRGGETDGRAHAEVTSAKARNVDVIFFRFMEWYLLGLANSPRLASALPLTELLPFVNDPLHFRNAGRCSVFWALFALEYRGNHFGNQRTIENFHVRRRRDSGNAEIGRPVQRILKLHVLVWRIGLGIFLQPDDQIRDRFRIDGKVATFGLLVAGPGAVGHICQEFLRAFLILGKVPDGRTIGDMRQCCYSHAVAAEQRRLQPYFFGGFWIFFFPRAQKTYAICGG